MIYQMLKLTTGETVVCTIDESFDNSETNNKIMINPLSYGYGFDFTEDGVPVSSFYFWVPLLEKNMKFPIKDQHIMGCVNLDVNSEFVKNYQKCISILFSKKKKKKISDDNVVSIFGDNVLPEDLH